MTGVGKHGTDYSYLTGRRALYVQNGNIVDPAEIDDQFRIDTTVRENQIAAASAGVERARHQTLVIAVAPLAGATLAATATLHLWAKLDWVETLACEEPGSSSKSSSLVCSTIPDPADLDPSDRWGLIEAGKHTDAVAGGFVSGLVFSFPWLPAGIYKAAIADGLTGQAVIAEQHTE